MKELDKIIRNYFSKWHISLLSKDPKFHINIETIPRKLFLFLLILHTTQVHLSPN